MLVCVIMAWLYIKPIRPTTPDEPTSDPVDSDPVTMLLPLNRRSDPNGVLLPSFETLTVFTCLAYSGEIQPYYPKTIFPLGVACQPRTTVCHFFSEEMNGKRTTIHLKMLNMREYDIQLTRRYHSIMLIHDWLHTRAFSPISPLHYMEIFTCARTLASPLPPVQGRLIGSSSPLPAPWLPLLLVF